MDGDDNAAEVLRSYLAGDPSRLTTVLTDPARARAVASDAAPGDSALRNALIAVSQLRATRVLSDPASPVQVLRSLVSRLEQEQGIGAGPAQRAITVWIAAIRDRSVDDVRRLIRDGTPSPLEETRLPEERPHDRRVPRRSVGYVAAAVLGASIIVGLLIVIVHPFSTGETSSPPSTTPATTPPSSTTTSTPPPSTPPPTVQLSDFFTGISPACRDSTADWPGVNTFDATQVIGCNFPGFIVDFHRWPTATAMHTYEIVSYQEYQDETVRNTNWRTSEGRPAGDFFIWPVSGGFEVLWTVDDVWMSGRMFAPVDSADAAEQLWKTSDGVKMDESYLR